MSSHSNWSEKVYQRVCLGKRFSTPPTTCIAETSVVYWEFPTLGTNKHGWSNAYVNPNSLNSSILFIYSKKAKKTRDFGTSTLTKQYVSGLRHPPGSIGVPFWVPFMPGDSWTRRLNPGAATWSKSVDGPFPTGWFNNGKLMLLLLEIHGMLLDDVVYHCWMLLLDDGFSGSPFIQQHPTTDDQKSYAKAAF